MNIHKNARLTPQGRLLLVERITEAGWEQKLKPPSINTYWAAVRQKGLPVPGFTVSTGFQ
jgi:hypothetical protein